MNKPTLSWNNLYRDLLTFVYPKVKDKAVAEDIVQEVFIKVHTRVHEVRDPEKIPGWIYRVTSNLVADHFRKSTRAIEPVNVDNETHEHEFNDCVAHCLRVLMGTLPEKYRVALELTEIENLSQHDLAQKLGISHSGARSRVQRARKMLKDKMNELFRIQTDAYGNVIVCENRQPCCCPPNC